MICDSWPAEQCEQGIQLTVSESKNLKKIKQKKSHSKLNETFFYRINK